MLSGWWVDEQQVSRLKFRTWKPHPICGAPWGLPRTSRKQQVSGKRRKSREKSRKQPRKLCLSEMLFLCPAVLQTCCYENVPPSLFFLVPLTFWPFPATFLRCVAVIKFKTALTSLQVGVFSQFKHLLWFLSNMGSWNLQIFAFCFCLHFVTILESIMKEIIFKNSLLLYFL